MALSRSTRLGAVIGASVGLMLALALLANWQLRGGGGGERLEGTTILAMLLSYPTSSLLAWMMDAPGYSVTFILLAPIIQYGLLGAGIGAVIHRPQGRLDHRKGDEPADT